MTVSVRLTQAVGRHRAGTVRRYDDVSAARLIDSGCAERVDVSHGESESDERFDPGENTVDEVESYLATADEDERERVLAAESAGKSRKSITGE